MSKLKEKRKTHLKDEEKELKAEIRENNSANRKWARELRDELHPSMFVNASAIADTLVDKGFYVVPKEYFFIAEGEYIDRAKACIKKSPYIKTLMDNKVSFVRGGPRYEVISIQASNAYILDEIEKYLAKHDIGLIDRVLPAANRFKFYILD